MAFDHRREKGRLTALTRSATRLGITRLLRKLFRKLRNLDEARIRTRLTHSEGTSYLRQQSRHL